MKPFERTGGHWIFYISVAYFVVGMFSIYNGADLKWAGPLYIFFLSMPFWFPPLGRAINLDVTWDQKMFDFFGFIKKNGKDAESSNVLKFPDHREYGIDDKQALPLPEKKEEPAKVFYRFGITDNNRLAFQMGYSELTMNRTGIQNLIDQLEFFKDQLSVDEDNE